MDFIEFGWRDGLLLATALAAVYLVVALLGLARLRHRRETPVASASVAPAIETGFVAPWLAAEQGDARAEAELPQSGQASFEGRLALTELQGEVRQLRAEVAALREELLATKTAQRVSPLYADAADLAKRGFDARGVADECGISVAEAELVLALSRDDGGFDSEVDDGKHGHDAAASATGR